VASRRRATLPILLAVALAATGVVSTVVKQTNPTILPTGLNVAVNAESTALYCTGLSSVAGGFAGHVTFQNTSGSMRILSVEVVSDTGAHSSRSIGLAGYSSVSIQPDHWVKGSSFGLGAEVDGGGVVAEEVTSNLTAQVPCTSAGVTAWYAGGFDTLVGSSAALSIYNPTATPAVVNVTTYSSNGFVAPAPFQGLSVAAHSQIELNLGTQVVNSSNVGVRVKVLRGSIDIVGLQRSGRVISMDPGTLDSSTVAWFPRVTTVNHAAARIRIMNPGPVRADVTVDIGLSPFTVNPITVSVSAFSSNEVVVTPNPAIPAAGYATVQLTSTQPVVASLMTGTNAGTALSPAQAPATTFLLSDFTQKGYDAATVTNTTSHPITVTVAILGRPSVVNSARLAPSTTSDIKTLFGVATLKSVSLLVTTSKPSLLVTATLPTNPVGVSVVSPLYGG
jgi:hypothetical protein